MNCKYCNAAMAEDEKICSACGKEQETAEETVAVEETVAAEEVAAVEEAVSEAAPAKANSRKLTTAVIAVVLVAGILIGLLAGSLGAVKPATDATVPATEAVEEEPVVIPSDGDPASPLCKASYTVSDEEAAAAADMVVATMGDKVLTNGQLQAYYWQELYMFLNENSSYAYYLGLDYYTPLDQQLMDMGEVQMSWQQFILDGAIASWKNYQALALEGEEMGHQLPAERQEELDYLAEQLQISAANAGFASADEMIATNVGASCSMEDYLGYVSTYYHGMSYYQDFCDALDPTAEEVEAFYAENEEYFISSGLSKEDKLINVRHVLLKPEGGETGEDGYLVYTDEAWEACRLQAEELYNQWMEGDMSEDSFAQLAMTHSVDGSAADGGLYEDVYAGRMVTAFNDWCFDESRQVGDHGLVKTQYGYHIMFFCGARNWEYYARNELIGDIAYDKIPATVEKYETVVDFSKIQLCDIKLA